jgi:CheY-like chemotaxis protein
VDDDAISLELMAMLLAHEGHQVFRAHDAVTALELLAGDKNSRPDVMLVDLQMPGVSGGQLAQRVRALGGPEPFLLAMSATEAQRQQLVAFDGFLLKPLTVEDLRRALDPLPAQKQNKEAIPSKKPKSTPAQANAVDMSVVGKLLTMMPLPALQDVMYACIADTRTCITTMERQCKEGDDHGVRQTAHRIKGAASMIGATHLAGIAASLESGSGEIAATPHVLDDLLSACKELEGMLLAGKFKTA